MANICSINIYIPLDKIPDKEEKAQLAALYEAEKKWKEAVKTDEELRIGKNYQNFIGSQPGVPFKRTEYKYEFFDDGDKKGIAKEGELKPDSEQWNQPTIHASFEERDGKILVCPYGFGRGRGLLFDEEDGISFHISKPDNSILALPYLFHIPVMWSFKHSFPWWAEIGFAGGKKNCDEESKDAPSGQSDEFYKKWYEEHGQPIPQLIWEHSVSEILKNLGYAVRVYENFPTTGLAWQMSWVWKELDKLKDIYKWMKQIYSVSSEAIAYLDWSEVAWSSGEFEWTRKNDSPNQNMLSIKRMEIDTIRFNEGKLSLEAFKRRHTLHLRKSKKDYRGYVPIAKRDPFYYLYWL